MPTFQTQITVDVEVEFEVFCTCGNGMCYATDTRESRNRRYPQAVVEPCPKCLQAARDEASDEVRTEMQMRIDELEAELENERRQLAAQNAEVTGAPAPRNEQGVMKMENAQTTNSVAGGASELTDVLERMRAKADNAYCDYIGQLRRDECLGWEIKVERGKFGEAELKAHCAAAEKLGRHRALHEAANMLSEVLRSNEV